MSTQNGTPIDLRSDTVTKPTPAMREAMANAEVGDDVKGEDPSVNRLEALAAEMLGKEAAVYVSSGTMGNLTSVLAHCGRGDEMILGNRGRIYISEQGGSAGLGGVHTRTVSNQPDGTLDLDEVKYAIQGDNEHFAVTKLLCLENTQNSCGGTVLPVAYMDAAGGLAHEHGLKLHVDGARIWNAAVALNVSLARLVQETDSVSCCLSKGLGAPVGSVVVGNADFIQRVRRNRKVVGGGMRQAGVIAAAGIVAMTEMVERLADDHENARALAEGIAQMDGLSVDLDAVQTDIVFWEVERDDMTALELAAALQERGVLVGSMGGKRMRAVTHHQISREDIDLTLDTFQDALVSGRGASGDVFVYG